MPRPHHDPELWNDDVEFLLQEADAALGLHGASFEPGSTIAPADLVERKIAMVFRARPAAARFRRVRAIWRRCRPETRDVLTVYYSTTSRMPPNATRLGQFALVALWMLDRDEKFQTALRLGKRELEDLYRPKAERKVRAAHRDWSKAVDRAAESWVDEEVKAS